MKVEESTFQILKGIKDIDWSHCEHSEGFRLQAKHTVPTPQNLRRPP